MRYRENRRVAKHLRAGDVSPISEAVRSYAIDPRKAKALWSKGEEMVGEGF